MRSCCRAADEWVYGGRWVDCQPDTCRQRVYFANHTSHLDAVVLWSALPRHLRAITRPVAAADYWVRGWLRPNLAESFNAMLIDRKEIKVHHSPIDLMIREIGDIYSLIIFPEGGNSSGEDVGPLKKRTVLPWQETSRPGACSRLYRQCEPCTPTR